MSASRAASCLPPVPLLCLAPSSGDFAAVSGAAFGGALGKVGSLRFSEAGPLVTGAGGEGTGAAVHHPGIQAAGHREGLEVAPEGRGQWQPVHQVHGRAGHHCPAAQVLQAQYLGKKRKPISFVLSWARGQHRASHTPVRPPLWDSGARCPTLCPRAVIGGGWSCFHHLKSSLSPNLRPPPSLPLCLRGEWTAQRWPMRSPQA